MFLQDKSWREGEGRERDRYRDRDRGGSTLTHILARAHCTLRDCSVRKARREYLVLTAIVRAFSRRRGSLN